MEQFLPFRGKLNPKIWSIILTLLAVVLLHGGLFAQQQGEIQISGTVTGPNGNSIPGANVLVQGSNVGTVTDVSGNFSLQVPEEAQTLVISFVGYETQEVAIDDQTEFNITMQEEVTALEELVVVGYGTQEKENLSGAVDAVDAKTLESRPINNISQGLQGVSPNLSVVSMSGEPGEAADFNIRGITSINEGEPLILVDGVPTDPWELNTLSPNNVESISVLKDASSAAIYGARAAFGVVLITTKSGTEKGINFNYSSNFSWDKPTILPDKITDPYIYSRLNELSTDNTPWDYVNHSDEYYQWAKERSENPSTPGVRVNPNDESLWQYMGGRDWSRYFLGDFNNSQRHHLSMSGSTEETQFFLSGGYSKQKGALELGNDYFDRYNMRGKVNYQATDWLNIGNNTLLTMTERKKPTYLNMWDIYNFLPTEWHKNPDGTWANTPVGEMGAQLTNGGNSNDQYQSFQTTFNGEMSFWEGQFRVNSDFTVRRGNTNYNRYRTKYNIGYGPNDVRQEGINEAFRSAIFENYNVFNIYGTFDKIFADKHHLTAIAGYNQEFYREEYFSATRDKVISSSLPTIALASGTAQVNENISDWAIRGAFYRLNYIFDEKYIVEFNGRYDGSSKFPKEDRFGFFPSASAAWRVDREGFMQSVDFLSMLKLRGSYGSLGNQFVTEYGYIPSMQASQADYMIGGALPQMVESPSLVSPNYTWERVSTVNFGLDLGFFDNALTANFDIYERDTEGMLTQGKDLPDVLGATEPNENAANLETKGWELSLAYSNDINVAGKPLTFDSKFILSDSRSWITKFDNPSKNLIQYYEGMELGEIWGLQSDGLFKSEDEIAELDETSIIPWGALNIVPGWPKYQDLDGNGAIEKGSTVDEPKDLSVIGNVTPRFQYGLNLGFNWNGFDVRAFFQGVGKRDYYPLDYLYWGFYQQPYAGGYEHLKDFYRGSADSDTERAKHSQAYIDAGLADANTDAKYPVLQAWLADRNLGERIDQAEGLAIPQTRYMLDASYLRVKNITLGYSLPRTLTQNIGLERVRVYVSGENMGEWSEVADYFDPEAINDSQDIYSDPTSNPDNREEGKGYAYPFQRQYSVGLNIQF